MFGNILATTTTAVLDQPVLFSFSFLFRLYFLSAALPWPFLKAHSTLLSILNRAGTHVTFTFSINSPFVFAVCVVFVLCVCVCVCVFGFLGGVFCSHTFRRSVGLGRHNLAQECCGRASVVDVRVLDYSDNYAFAEAKGVALGTNAACRA